MACQQKHAKQHQVNSHHLPIYKGIVKQPQRNSHQHRVGA